MQPFTLIAWLWMGQRIEEVLIENRSRVQQRTTVVNAPDDFDTVNIDLVPPVPLGIVRTDTSEHLFRAVQTGSTC